MSAQHVIVGGDDPNIWHQFVCQTGFVFTGTRSHTVGEVATGKTGTRWPSLRLCINSIEISLAVNLTSLSDSFSHFFDDRVQHFSPFIV
jgi:hypothetical protein